METKESKDKQKLSTTRTVELSLFQKNWQEPREKEEEVEAIQTRRTHTS
jgi:hypothetical protein